MKTFTSQSAKQTLDFAKDFAKKLKGGEVIALIGDLGAGKTVFAKGLARGLGIKRKINSPTFVLMKNYKVKPKNGRTKERKNINQLVHIDCYRVKNPTEILDIGAQEYWQDKNTVTVIEWADKIKKILPRGAVFVHISHLKNGSRKIRF